MFTLLFCVAMAADIRPDAQVGNDWLPEITQPAAAEDDGPIVSPFRHNNAPCSVQGQLLAKEAASKTSAPQSIEPTPDPIPNAPTEDLILDALRDIRDRQLDADTVRTIVREELDAHRKIVLEYQDSAGKRAMKAVDVDVGSGATKSVPLPPGSIVTHIDGIPVTPHAASQASFSVKHRSADFGTVVEISPKTYQGRWNNYDGLTKRQHAEIMHGIDTSGLTDSQVARQLDHDHDRHGPGHPKANRNACPGGVCPTTPTTRSRTGPVLRFWRR